MKRLLLVRHGETEWNAVRRLQGQADIALSREGGRQAAALAQTVNQLRPDRILCSDLLRATQTAALMGCSNVRISKDLREIDVGAWTGQAIADIVAREPELYSGWRAGRATPPGGELWDDFRRRTAQATVAALQDAQRLLVVCHGGVIRALIQSFLDLAPSRIVPVGPGSLSVLAHRPNETGMRLEVFNFTPGSGPLLDAPD